jgi:hypothetical protein
VKQGGLAAPVGADEANPFPFVQLKRTILEDGTTPVVFKMDVFQVDQRHCLVVITQVFRLKTEVFQTSRNARIEADSFSSGKLAVTRKCSTADWSANAIARNPVCLV